MRDVLGRTQEKIGDVRHGRAALPVTRTPAEVEPAHPDALRRAGLDDLGIPDAAALATSCAIGDRIDRALGIAPHPEATRLVAEVVVRGTPVNIPCRVPSEARKAGRASTAARSGLAADWPYTIRPAAGRRAADMAGPVAGELKAPVGCSRR